MPESPPSHRVLHSPMRAYRIGDPSGRYPIYSGEGAARTEGRWHEKGQEVIYASEHYSTAMLEKLVHWNGILPPNQHFVTIEIPSGISYEVVTKDSLAGWIHQDVARRFGSRWLADRRSAALLVPSIVARMERNILINPQHPDARLITAGLEEPVVWDGRLFRT
jgi:RES domain-containing protein